MFCHIGHLTLLYWSRGRTPKTNSRNRRLAREPMYIVPTGTVLISSFDISRFIVWGQSKVSRGWTLKLWRVALTSAHSAQPLIRIQRYHIQPPLPEKLFVSKTMPVRPTALRFARQIGPTLRPSLARVGSLMYLSSWAGLKGLKFLRQISGQQTSQIPFERLRPISLGTKLKWRQRCYSSDDSAPMTDPSRPDLFYHVLSPPTPISSSLPAFGLSYVSKPPPSADSSAIIGWLPAASKGEGQEAGLNDFKENRESILAV